MTSGSTASLVDTNIPVYAIDPRDPFKQQRAMDVLDHLDAAGTGIIGVQNLNEFISVSTRRIIPPLPMDETESQSCSAKISIPGRRWMASGS